VTAGGAYYGGRGQMGDPGIFGDIGRFIGGAAGSIPIVGGLIGGGITALSNALDPIKSAPPAAPMPQLPPPPAPGGSPYFNPEVQRARNGINVPFGGGKGMGIPTPAGRISFFENGNGMQSQESMRAGKASRSGYHWNKTGYYTRAGYVAPGTKEVKNRRRNSLNPRALDRALSRVTSAKKASKKLSRVTIRKPASCR